MSREIVLHFDDADYDHTQQAIAMMQAMSAGEWPDPVSDQRELGEKRDAWNTPDPLADGSNIAGLAIAEICRGWVEMLDFEVMSRPREDQFKALIERVKSVIAKHDEQAKCCNFERCGCDGCVVLRPAIEAAEKPQS